MMNIITKLNELLAKEMPFDDFHKDINLIPELPVIFIVGLPRSGTTPLAQLLIQRFRLGYVSNLIAKFWNAPELGISLTREISDDPGKMLSSALESNYGFTAGYEDHHEFGYFWRRWFDFGETHYLDQNAQSSVDVKGLQKALSVMEKIWERPLFFKNPAALPLQTAFLASILSTSLFVHIKRGHTDVAISLFNGWQKRMGDTTRWFSIKPREYPFLKDKPIPEQIAGQVFYTQKEIDNQLRLVPDQRKICLSFSDLCEDPDHELERIGCFLKNNYPNIDERDVALPALSPSSENMDSDLLHQIETCLKRLNSQEL